MVLLSAILLCVAAAELQPIDGTFIQYSQRYLARLTPETWTRELAYASEAGLRILIIQRLSTGSHSFLPEDGTAFDPTEILLDYADKHAMGVFMGLADDAGWWRRPFDGDFLSTMARTNLDVARGAWARYGRHPSFHGWYIPQEPWDVWRPGRISALANFLCTVAEGCRKIAPGKAVSISPFFTGKVSPVDFETLYKQILKSAYIDIVMLQDGVGARGLDHKVDSVIPYFRAMAAACNAAHVELWSDVEIFTQDYKPCDIGRLTRQLKAESPYVERQVVFEFFHYMSPTRGEKQQALFQNYKEFKRNSVTPISMGCGSQQ